MPAVHCCCICECAQRAIHVDLHDVQRNEQVDSPGGERHQGLEQPGTASAAQVRKPGPCSRAVAASCPGRASCLLPKQLQQPRQARDVGLPAAPRGGREGGLACIEVGPYPPPQKLQHVAGVALLAGRQVCGVLGAFAVLRGRLLHARVQQVLPALALAAAVLHKAVAVQHVERVGRHARGVGVQHRCRCVPVKGRREDRQPHHGQLVVGAEALQHEPHDGRVIHCCAPASLAFAAAAVCSALLQLHF